MITFQIQIVQHSAQWQVLSGKVLLGCLEAFPNFWNFVAQSEILIFPFSGLTFSVSILRFPFSGLPFSIFLKSSNYFDYSILFSTFRKKLTNEHSDTP